MNHDNKVRGLSFIVISGLAIAILCSLLFSHWHHLPYPFDFYHLPELIYYCDFTTVWLTAQDYSPYQLKDIAGVYFPFAYLPFFLLNHCSINFSLNCYFSVFLIGSAWLNYHFFIDKKLTFTDHPVYYFRCITLSFLSYPVLFCLQRGNIDGLVFILTCLFVLSFQKKQFALSVLWLTMATAMKGYPGIFCLLFLSDKHYKVFFMFIVATLGLSWSSLLFFKGSISYNLSHLFINLNYFNHYLILSHLSTQHNSSLYGFFKTLYLMTQHIPWNTSYSSATTAIFIYSVFAFVLLLGLSAYSVFCERIFWRKLTILTAIILLLPQIAFDYRQIFLFLPIYYFVNATDSFQRQQDKWYVILFGLLLIPKNYAFLYGQASISDSLTVVLLILLTVRIIMTALRYPTMKVCR